MYMPTLGNNARLQSIATFYLLKGRWTGVGVVFWHQISFFGPKMVKFKRACVCVCEREREKEEST